MAVPDKYPRAWVLWKSARPSQLALVLLVYALGVGMERARAATPVVPWTPVLAGAGVLVLVATGVHYANEYADVETDRLTERTPFSGGSGALQRTGVDRGVLARASSTVVVAAVVSCAAMWWTGLLSTRALALLAVILGFGLAYSLPPAALVRRGVGEVTNAVLGGFCLPLFGVAVVGRVTWAVAAAVLPFTMLVGCNLVATHWPDREADARTGKRTLAVRWSARGLRRGYWTLAAGAVLSTAALAGTVLPPSVVAGQALALPLLLWGGVVVTRQRSPFPAVGAMVVYACVSAAAWWWLAL
ncbi:prenyltransferase [Halomicroarcula sp. F13]|uniref:Prenyltransferase n=2 Tax=Haloarcula rubra TaxID=2487747 RepID=A0AAW4PTT2_9EURY|nr:prenyltransferase [Halomicroarcula rubra]